MENLGNRAKELRIEAGLTLRQLAGKIGTSDATISRFENGSLNIRYSTLLKIFAALEGTTSQPLEVIRIEYKFCPFCGGPII